MKVLLDENLPHQLRRELTGHDFYTAAYMGYAGVENGELLRRAAADGFDGFDALVTNDRGLEYQQNLDELPVAVVVILVGSNTLEALRPIFPALLAALAALQPQSFVKVLPP